MNPGAPRVAVLGLFSQRRRWGLTWRGAAVLFLLLIVAGVLCVSNVHHFLAVNAPVPGDYLVIEGWIPEYAVQECAKRYKAGEFHHLVTVGGAVSAAGPKPADDDTYAYVAAERLRQVADQRAIHMVPTKVQTRDRTYSSAVSLREWFQRQGHSPQSLTVATLGPHARRTRLLYEKAFGSQTRIGIIAIQDREYDPSHWWRFSEGVKEVLSEGSAYIYARFLFRPDVSEK